MNADKQTDSIQRLRSLEFSIRQSMTVREDQDEPAELRDREASQQCGITVDESATKGDLLNAVQTLLRATQANAQSRS